MRNHRQIRHSSILFRRNNQLQLANLILFLPYQYKKYSGSPFNITDLDITLEVNLSGALGQTLPT